MVNIWYYVVCITIILCNNVSFYRYKVSQEDGSMPCDRPVNVLLYLLIYYCAKLHLLLLCHWRIKFLLLSSSSSPSSFFVYFDDCNYFMPHRFGCLPWIQQLLNLPSKRTPVSDRPRSSVTLSQFDTSTGDVTGWRARVRIRSTLW